MYTYVITTEDKQYLKIGKTIDVNKRLSSLQTSSPVTLILEGYFIGDIESLLHKEFKNNRVKNEWFIYTIKDSLVNKPGFTKAEKKKESGVVDTWTNVWLMYQDNLGAKQYVSATVWKELSVGDTILMTDIEGYNQARFFKEVIKIKPSRKLDNSKLVVMEIISKGQEVQLNSWGEDEEGVSVCSIYDAPHSGISGSRKKKYPDNIVIKNTWKA